MNGVRKFAQAAALVCVVFAASWIAGCGPETNNVDTTPPEPAPAAAPESGSANP
jgi:hypothetical protein